MVTIIKFSPIPKGYLLGSLLRWQSGVGLGSFVSEASDLVIINGDSHSRPCELLTHILTVSKHPFTLRVMPIAEL